MWMRSWLVLAVLVGAGLPRPASAQSSDGPTMVAAGGSTLVLGPGEERTVNVGRFDELIVLDVAGIDVEQRGADALHLVSRRPGGRAVIMLRTGSSYRTVMVDAPQATAIDRSTRRPSEFSPELSAGGTYVLVGGAGRSPQLSAGHTARWSQAIDETQVGADISVLHAGGRVGVRHLAVGVDRPTWRVAAGDTFFTLLPGFRGFTGAGAQLRGVDIEVGPRDGAWRGFGVAAAHTSTACCAYFDANRLALGAVGVAWAPEQGWQANVASGVMTRAGDPGPTPFTAAGVGYVLPRAGVQLRALQSGPGGAIVASARAGGPALRAFGDVGYASGGLRRPLGSELGSTVAGQTGAVWRPVAPLEISLIGNANARDRPGEGADGARGFGQVFTRYEPTERATLVAHYQRGLTVTDGDAERWDSAGAAIGLAPTDRVSTGASTTFTARQGLGPQFIADLYADADVADGWRLGGGYRLNRPPVGRGGDSHRIRAYSSFATTSAGGRIQLTATRSGGDRRGWWYSTVGSASLRLRRTFEVRTDAHLGTVPGDSRLAWGLGLAWTVHPSAFRGGGAAFGFRGGVDGIVFLDEDGDGTLDDDESGLSGMALSLNGSRELTTGEDGRFKARSLQVGEHTVVLDRELLQSLDGLERSFEVRPLGRADVSYALSWGGRIRGLLYNDLDGDGRPSRSDPAVRASTVVLRDARGVVKATVEARGGRFEFTGLASGEYTVLVDPLGLPQGFSPVDSLEQRVIVSEGRAEEMSIRLDAARAIGGVVWHDIDGDGRGGTAGDIGLGGIEVHLSNGLVTRTGPDGTYLFRGLAPGGYAVTTELTTQGRVALLRVEPTEVLDLDFLIPAAVQPRDRSAAAPSRRPPEFVAGLVLDAPSRVLPAGVELQVTATAILSNGDLREVTSRASWSSSDADVLTVSETGTVAGLSPGTAGVTATWREGLADPLTFEVLDPELDEIRLSPVGLRLNPGDIADLRVDAVDRAGRGGEVTAVVHWFVSDPDVALLDESGRLVALREGSVQLRARVGETWSDPIQVDVVVAMVTGISIDGVPARMPLGATAPVRASGYDTQLQVRDVTGEVVWESSDPAVVHVDQEGTLSALAPGQARISASIGSILARSRTISVTNQPPVTLEILPAEVHVALGERTRLRAWATFEDGKRGPVTTVVNWEVAGAAAAVGPDGTVVPLHPGEVIVRATYLGVSADPVTVKVFP